MSRPPSSDRHEPASRQLDDELWLGTAPKLRADNEAPDLTHASTRTLSFDVDSEQALILEDPYGKRGGIMAMAVHALLIAALFFSVQWSTKPPVALQAELWTALPSTPSTPVPPPVPVVPPPPPPEVVEPVKPPVVKPDIALPDEKKKKPPKEEPKKEEPKKEVKKETPKKEEPKKEEPKKDIKKEPAKPDPAMAKLRDDDLKRALAAAGGATGPANSNVNAAGVRGDPGYSDKIRARILGNIVFNAPSDMAGNPEAVFVVDQLPTGEILSVKKIKSSGVSAWDDAVERAIRKSDPLPKGKDGTVTRQLELSFRPKDVR